MNVFTQLIKAQLSIMVREANQAESASIRLMDYIASESQQYRDLHDQTSLHPDRTTMLSVWNLIITDCDDDVTSYVSLKLPQNIAREVKDSPSKIYK